MTRNYIRIIRNNHVWKHPFKLLFEGEELETMASYNEEADVFEYGTDQQALTAAITIRDSVATGNIYIISSDSDGDVLV